MTDGPPDDRQDRFRRLPPDVPRERLVADRGHDTHEEWDDAFRETTWFVRFVG
jgi:hypothetical protein